MDRVEGVKNKGDGRMDKVKTKSLKEQIETALKIADWFNILPQAIDEHIVDIRAIGSETQTKIFNNSNELKEILQTIQERQQNG